MRDGASRSRAHRLEAREGRRRMKLSDELFEQIVTSLAAGEAITLPSVTLTESSSEQRRAPRYVPGRDARVTLIPLTDALAPGPLDLELRDVSPGGVKFIFPN